LSDDCPIEYHSNWALYLKFKTGKVLILKVHEVYEHEIIKTEIDSSVHHESMKYAIDAIEQIFLKYRKFY